MTYTFLVIALCFLFSVAAGLAAIWWLIGWNRALVVTAYYTVIFGCFVLGYQGPVTWTARWEEAKFFDEGVATSTVVRELESGRLLVRFISTDGRWHSARVDRDSRLTSDGIRIPDSVQL